MADSVDGLFFSSLLPFSIALFLKEIEEKSDAMQKQYYGQNRRVVYRGFKIVLGRMLACIYFLCFWNCLVALKFPALL